MKRTIPFAAVLAALLALTLCLSGCGSPNAEEPATATTPEASQQTGSSDEKAAAAKEKDEAADRNVKEESSKAQATEAGNKADSAKTAEKKAASTSSQASKATSKDSKPAKNQAATSSKKPAAKPDSTSSKKPLSGSSGSSSSGSSSTESQEKPTAPASKTIQVTVSIDGAGYIAAVKGKKVELEEGSTVFDALKKAATSIGGNKRYVSSINGLAEKEHGALSGWMYDVNGSTPMVPCGQYELKNGDSVLWHYENAQD